MNDHQHAAIEQARIAWHDHQFEHGCYGRDCAEDRRLYRVYQRAIDGDLAEPGPATTIGLGGGPRGQAGPLVPREAAFGPLGVLSGPRNDGGNWDGARRARGAA